MTLLLGYNLSTCETFDTTFIILSVPQIKPTGPNIKKVLISRGDSHMYETGMLVGKLELKLYGRGSGFI